MRLSPRHTGASVFGRKIAPTKRQNGNILAMDSPRALFNCSKSSVPCPGSKTASPRSSANGLFFQLEDFWLRRTPPKFVIR